MLCKLIKINLTNSIMTKKFVQITCRQRKYKLNTADIKHAYIINKKSIPLIPKFSHSLEHLKS